MFVDFVTIASTGNASDFGDLVTAVSEGPGAASNQTRAVLAGGNVPAGRTNVMQYITMAQLGDSVDFGDLTFSNATITARGALIYNSTQANRAICALDFGADKTATSGTFTIQFPNFTSSSAILRIA